MTDKYWASEPFEMLGGVLGDKINKYYQHIQLTGRITTWQNVNYHYHHTYYNGADLRQAGDNGEFELLTINHFKNILHHMINMVSGEDISYSPRTTNTDSKSQKQALLSQNILEYYISERKVDRKLRIVDKYALLYGEGYIELVWDASLGEVADYDVTDDGDYDKDKPIKEGDITFATYTPDNVIRDTDASEFELSDWIIIRKIRNKWNLAAKYPEIAEDIIAIDSRKTSAWDQYIGDSQTYEPTTGDDHIEMYTFYHKRTPAMPNGRMVDFLADTVVLVDTVLPHKDIPVFREVPEEQENSAFGTTIAYDLVQIQEAINILHSTIITNQKTFGIDTIVVPKNSDYRFEALAEGLSVIEYRDGPGGKPPSTLSLLNTKAEIFQYAKELVSQMEQISGVNSVVRGAPQSSLESGSALALVHSTAIQFNQSRHLSYINVVSDVGTNIIAFLKQFALTKRVIAISGKSNRSYLKEFNNEDITDINRVTMDVQNPVMASTAGRVQLGEQLISAGLIKNPQEFLTLINTGRLETLFEHEMAEIMLIHTENEEIAEGKPQIAILTDDHLLHIKEHKAILASPDARRSPELVDLALSHIQEHINMLQDPNNSMLLGLVGQPQLPPEQAPGAAQPPGATEPGGTPDMPSLPEMPSVPGGGEYDPATGEAAPGGQPKAQYDPATGA